MPRKKYNILLFELSNVKEQLEKKKVHWVLKRVKFITKRNYCYWMHKAWLLVKINLFANASNDRKDILKNSTYITSRIISNVHTSHRMALHFASLSYEKKNLCTPSITSLIILIVYFGIPKKYLRIIYWWMLRVRHAYDNTTISTLVSQLKSYLACKNQSIVHSIMYAFSNYDS